MSKEFKKTHGEILEAVMPKCIENDVDFLLITKDSNGFYSITSTDSKLLNLLDASNKVCIQIAPQIVPR